MNQTVSPPPLLQIMQSSDENVCVSVPIETFKNMVLAVGLVGFGLLVGLATILVVMTNLVKKMDILVKLLRRETGTEPSNVVRARLMEETDPAKDVAQGDMPKKRGKSKAQNGTSCAEIEEGDEHEDSD